MHAGGDAPDALLHARHRRCRTGLDGADHARNFLRRLGSPLGQLAYFVGNDGKTAAGFAGTCRLDGGIERQQVGLIGDFLDGVDNGGNLPRLLTQRLDRRRRLVDRLGDSLDFVDHGIHDPSAFRRHLVRTTREFLGVLGILGNVVDAHCRFLDCGGHARRRIALRRTAGRYLLA
ncbi:hypothetical protein SDC9_180280 [bioreactor metagenome]|uniref:Uncharacterized protein n=1 Tax=bioreactor metagenome TaxID=1076179 RepID=A0A645H2A3_9ZZZZ